jgi:hypothetical protein
MSAAFPFGEFQDKYDCKDLIKTPLFSHTYCTYTPCLETCGVSKVHVIAILVPSLLEMLLYHYNENLLLINRLSFEDLLL